MDQEKQPANELNVDLGITPKELDQLAARMVIDLTPEGMKTPEGIEKVTKATDEWDSAAHEVANAVQHFLDAHGSDVRQVLRQHGDFGAALEDLHQITALVGARSRKQDAFLRAVAGQ